MADELRGPLPVKVDPTSNGEFRPVPLPEHVARANTEAERRIGEHARRVGLGRRAFLQSLCGAATTFLTLNEAFAALGNTGGLFHVPRRGVRGGSGRRRAGRRRVHLRRADPHGRSGGRLAQLRRTLLGADPRQLPSRLVRRRRPGRLLLGRAVHQARLHGQRYGARGALVRAGIAREQPAVARRSKSGPRAGRPDEGASGCFSTPWWCPMPARRWRRSSS